MWKRFLVGLFVCCARSSSYTFRQLSFSGGGSFGAVEIGILKRISETETLHYDLYTGISAGAINSGILSYFHDVREGVRFGEEIYKDLRDRDVFELFPFTGTSLLNTRPLENTLTSILLGLPSHPVVPTLIGATNLFTGKLDIFSFEKQNDTEKILLLRSSSSIPGVFPPVHFQNSLYVDGRLLTNELFEVRHNHNFLNITFITPSTGFVSDDTPIDSLASMIQRTLQILYYNFNNPLISLNQNCKHPKGEIHQFYVDAKHLSNFSSYVNRGKELMDIGYNHLEKKIFKIC